MGFFPKEVEAVPLHLNRKLLGIGLSEQQQCIDHKLGGLAATLALHQGSMHLHSGSGVQLAKHVSIKGVLVHHALQVLSCGPIVEGQESVVAKRPHPSTDTQIGVKVGVVQQRRNQGSGGGLGVHVQRL